MSKYTILRFVFGNFRCLFIHVTVVLLLSTCFFGCNIYMLLFFRNLTICFYFLHHNVLNFFLTLQTSKGTSESRRADESPPRRRCFFLIRMKANT